MDTMNRATCWKCGAPAPPALVLSECQACHRAAYEAKRKADLKEAPITILLWILALLALPGAAVLLGNGFPD